MLHVATKRDWWAAVLLLAPLALFYNTYWAPPLALKYAALVVCATLACVCVAPRQGVPIPIIGLMAWTVLSLILCLDYYNFDPLRDADTLTLFLFSIGLAWIGFIAIPRVHPTALLVTLTVVLSIILAQIYWHYDTLTDPLSAVQLGTLTYDSYPIFGMIAGLAGLLFLHWRWHPLALVGLAAVMYVLLYGSARGELISFLGVAVLMVFPRAMIVLLPLAATALWLGIVFSDFPVLTRLRDAEGLPVRVQLLTDAFAVLSRDKLAAFMGMGINGFQERLHLDLGFYPHNSLLEALLSGGIVYLALYGALLIVPLVTGFRRPDRIFWAIPALMFALSLKSFSIFTNWLLMYFLALAYVPRRRIQRD